MEAMQLSWPSPSSWQFGMWPKHGILLFGQGPSLRGAEAQGYVGNKFPRLPDEANHSSGLVSVHARS
jgi:hypothetical protein